MSTEPAGDSADTMPRQVRHGTLVLFILGGILFLSGSYLYLVRDSIAADTLARLDADAAAELTRSDVVGQLMILVLLSALFAVLSVLAGYNVRQGRGWARYLGIGIGVLFGVLGLQSLLAGSLALFSIAQFLLAVAVVTFLIGKPAAAWCARRPPAGTQPGADVIIP
ncbi:hypothetical protein BH20ACT5_BH20ACT5_24520 [soil metagenome]